MTAPLVSFLLFLLVVFPGGVLPASTASASAAVPTVTAVPGTPVLQGTSFNLSQVGYEQSEFFLSGTADAYAPAPNTSLTSNGQWNVQVSATASYTTRAVVYRPINPAKFNGTVVVEWLNVSGGLDDAPDWTLAHNELVRDGSIWVGVSAQAVGVNQLKCPSAPPLPSTCVAPGDPARYASLSHPGDSFSYDIYSQAGQAIRDDGRLMLGGLAARKVIAMGESQSAGRLLTYVDAAEPLVHVYDGFLVHSESAVGAPLSQSPQANIPAPRPTMFRNDVPVPVFLFETETDVANSHLFDRQPDTSRFRLWEVAGSSHFDFYGLDIGPTDTGNGQGAVLNLAAMQNPPSNPPPGFDCTLPINTGGTHWALNAAVFWLDQWVVHGIQPPLAPRLATSSTPGSPVVFVTDANGTVLGGVRTPQVDAPIAALGGVGNTPAPGAPPLGVSCPLFGTTVPFSASKLASLYPSHFQFVLKWDTATVKDALHGYLLPADAFELANSAANSQIGG
jgi:hypothetical protein